MVDEKNKSFREKDVSEAKLKLEHLNALEGLSTKEKQVYAIYHHLSIATLYKWKKAYKAKGMEGLIRKSRCDKGNMRTCSKEMKSQIETKYLQQPDSSIVVFHSVWLL
jgi:transposase